MIGPHEGKELELMLAGKKHLAVFYDSLLPDVPIPEEVIPEQKFSLYVENGKIKRFSEDLFTKKGIVKYVCFTTSGEEWRASAFLWAKKEGFSHRRPFDEAYEYFIGRLLGYEEKDILYFIRK